MRANVSLRKWNLVYLTCVKGCTHYEQQSHVNTWLFPYYPCWRPWYSFPITIPKGAWEEAQLKEHKWRSADVPQPDRLISPRHRFRRLTCSEFPPDAEVWARSPFDNHSLRVRLSACVCVWFFWWCLFEHHLLIKSVMLKDTPPHADQRGQGPWTTEPSLASLPHLHLWFSGSVWSHADDLPCIII